MLLTADSSCLLVIDVQSRLAPAVAGHEQVIANSAVLMRAAARLGVPMLVSEQYPEGLGPTVPELASLAPDGAILAKTHFSCLGDDTYAGRFTGLGRAQAVLCGIEAHVCVLQTALALSAAGAEVFVVGDAVSSRRQENADAALARLGASGAAIVSTEMVVFEWLEKAGTPEFKEVSALIR